MPFCKYCFSSRMKRAIYTNHNTFLSMNGDKIIECKNLAKTKCTKCKHVGHTSKHCNSSVQLTSQSDNEVDSSSSSYTPICTIQKYILGIFAFILFVYYYQKTMKDSKYEEEYTTYYSLI